MAVGVFDFEPMLAVLRVKRVAQDSEEPSPQIRSYLVSGQVRPCLHQRFLHQVVGSIRLTRQRHGEGPQRGDRGQQLLLERTVRLTQFPSPLPATAPSSCS